MNWSSEHWNLIAAAIGWLRYEQRCKLVCWERSPFRQSSIYRPDLLGLTAKRQVIEVEIKMSVADFKSNEKKRGIVWRRNGYSLDYPLRFYFAVPRPLVDAVKPMLTEGCGLITTLDVQSTYGPAIHVVRGATSNPTATLLSDHQIVRMAMHQTGTLHRAVKSIAEIVEQERQKP